MKTAVQVGEPFGRLVVIGRADRKSKNRQLYWLCLCECGNTTEVRTDGLTTGDTRSCGCFHEDCAALRGIESKTHGEARPPTAEYRTWKAIIARCYNSRSPAYHNYGGRGISLFDGWRYDYMAFLAYVGRKPSRFHSLDRYPNNDGNYEPGNVRWATRTEQTRNQRTNRLLTIDGVTKCLSEWAHLSGVSNGTIWYRLKLGWKEDARLIQPARPHIPY